MSTGELNPNEPHQQQLYVGSAGYKNTFAYDKCIEITLMSVLRPDKAFSWGGDYRIPVYYGLLSHDFVQELRMAGSYDDASFSREFLSKWTNSVEGSFFNFDKLSRLRKIVKAEWSPTLDENVFYVASVDVARSSARTIVEIFKVRRGSEFFTKKLVNIIPMEGRNFLYQAAKIKELDATFNFDAVVIDTNGLGVGLVDILMAPTVDTNGLEHGAWNIINIKQYSKQFERDQTIGATPKIFVIKTNQHSAGDIHTNCYNEIFSGRVELLIDEKEAKDKLITTKKGQAMKTQERLRYMEPYKWTSMLIAETSNLQINRTNTYLKLERIHGNTEKDTFSALEYALWYVKDIEKEYYAKMNRGGLSYGKFMIKN